MDAKTTARYIDKKIDEAVESAQSWRDQIGKSLQPVLKAGSRATSAHNLDRLIEHEADAVAWLEIRDIAGGKASQVGHDVFLDAVRKVRGEIIHYLRTSRHDQTGTYMVQALAQHNAATKVLSGTDVVDLIDDENEEK
jgi:hypothetical protein